MPIKLRLKGSDPFNHIKGRNMDKAFEYMAPEMDKITNQEDGFNVAMDLKKITKTGLCMDELKEDITKIALQEALLGDSK